jgi:hypothetical protein
MRISVVCAMLLASACAFAPATHATRLAPFGAKLNRRGTTIIAAQQDQRRMPRSTTRARVPPPPPGTAPASTTFFRWIGIQFTSDALTLSALCLATQTSPIELLVNQSLLLWVILGPALVTFGAVWARITQTQEIPDFETDFIVLKLGGADAVRGLRYDIIERMRF